MNTVLTLQTGTPFTVFSSYRQRADQNGDPNNGPKTTDKWFNTSVFARPASGTFGNAGRNIINGPGLVNLDTAVVRVFRLTERFQLQFRGQAYNTLNHPNFNYPNATRDSAAFGSISSAGDPRILEGALRLIF